MSTAHRFTVYRIDSCVYTIDIDTKFKTHYRLTLKNVIKIKNKDII